MTRKTYAFEVTHDADDGWIVSDGYSLVYGTGDTALEALRDYATSLLEWVKMETRDLQEVTESEPER